MCDMLEDHNQIRAIMTELRTQLVPCGMPKSSSFATARWSLTRHLLRHLAAESDVLRRQGRASDSSDALEQRYRHHITDWHPARIEREWHNYRRELNRILDDLDRRMDYEDREFYSASVPIEVAFDRGIAMRYAGA